LAIWPLVQRGFLTFLKKLKKETKRNFWGSKKDPLFYLRIFSVLILGILVFSLTFYSPPVSGDYLSTKNFFLKEKQEPQTDLFVGQKENGETGDLHFKLIQKNSLVGFSVPTFITPKSLASLDSENDFSENNRENEKEIVEYIIQPGETLSSLAEKFKISEETILWANNLQKDSRLKVGQKILILPVSGVLHYVKTGENLSQIAKKYQADIDEISVFNDLSNGEIFPGDILIIPNGIMPSPQKRNIKKPSQSFFVPEVPLANSYFIFPTQGKISQGLHWYNAIDIASSCGTPIYAAAQGQILKIKSSNSGLGNYIVISHPNDTTTWYGHLQTILVKTGENVSQGQIVGYMGKTGWATGCHLHFEVRGARNPFAK